MAMPESKRDDFEDLMQGKLELINIKLVDRDDVKFNSRLHFLGSNTIELTMPRIRGQIPPVAVKDKLDLSCTLSTGQKLLFYGKVSKISVSDDPQKPSIITIAWPDDYKKMQMRQDVRIKCAIKVYYSDTLNDAGFLKEEEQHAGVLSDLSRGGGFLITTNKTYFVNKIIYIYVMLKRDGKKAVETILPTKVVVVKKFGMYEGEQVQGMALAFQGITQRTEKNLSKWIFEEQRLQLAERKRM